MIRRCKEEEEVEHDEMIKKEQDMEELNVNMIWESTDYSLRQTKTTTWSFHDVCADIPISG